MSRCVELLLSNLINKTCVFYRTKQSAPAAAALSDMRRVVSFIGCTCASSDQKQQGLIDWLIQKLDSAEPEIFSLCSHAFLFLYKTWCLHYQQCNPTSNNFVRQFYYARSGWWILMQRWGAGYGGQPWMRQAHWHLAHTNIYYSGHARTEETNIFEFNSGHNAKLYHTINIL